MKQPAPMHDWEFIELGGRRCPICFASESINYIPIQLIDEQTPTFPAAIDVNQLSAYQYVRCDVCKTDLVIYLKGTGYSVADDEYKAKEE